MAALSQISNSELIKSAARKFVEFVNNGPSPYHVVSECRKVLTSRAGFKELKEKDHWNVKVGEKYFVTRNQSSIVAFAIGGNYKPGNGFSIVGAHTDSPCLKVKPNSKKNKCGYHQVGVECYGGGIWATWFDRDLKVAGRTLIKKDDKLEHHLVHIDRPILRIPHLAIHLQRDINDKFSPNKETHLVPILSTAVYKGLVGTSETTKSEDEKDAEDSSLSPRSDSHQPLLMKLVAEGIGCEPREILDFDLHLADSQPATLGGVLEEFIFSPRLDNQVSCFCALQALVQSVEGSSLASDPNIRMIALYDNEEVGSMSAQGAKSMLTEHIMRRLACGENSTGFEEAIPKSFVISADQAHAVHPNYADKHEDNHKAALHEGPVIKINSNQRYATTAVSSSIIRVIAEKTNVPLQEICVRNDSTCGTTIGPIMSAQLGLLTLDIGGPQLAMHSIREMCCTSIIHQETELFKGFFEQLPAVLESMTGAD